MSYFRREPIEGVDPNNWAYYELEQNRFILGALTAYLFNVGNSLYLYPGKIGIDNNTVAGTITIDANTLINISGEALPLIEKSKDVQGDYSAWIIVNILFTITVIFILLLWGQKTLRRK